jgi:hypothetical protein
MTSTAPSTALPGQSRSSNDALAKGLGYFSIALGVTELLAPGALCRMLGMEGREGLLRAYGLREVATGMAILRSHDATPWIWGRVAGDALDVGTVAAALNPKNPKRDNVVGAIGALLGVTVLDAICASQLSREKGNRKTAVADYGDRVGFPRPVGSMRGAARDFKVPADMVDGYGNIEQSVDQASADARGAKPSGSRTHKRALQGTPA